MTTRHTLWMVLLLSGCSAGWFGKGRNPDEESDTDTDTDADTDTDTDTDADTDTDTDTDVPDPNTVDDDGDGYTEQQGDCDDADTDVGPGEDETPYDGIDNDCDPTTADDDLDGDGVLVAEDCDDTDASASPMQDEIVGDGIDNDCDGEADERFEIEVVDAGCDCGFTTAIDTDSEDNVHLAYANADDGTLLYQHRDSETGAWEKAAETIDGTSFAGEWADAKVDGADRFQVAYTWLGYDGVYSGVSQSVWFAYRDSDGAWSDNYVVDSYADSLSTNLGEYVSLAVDSSNVPSFLYQDGDGIYNALGLRYAVPVLRAFIDLSFTTVEVAVGIDTPYVAGSGYFTDLEVDSADEYHSAWYDDSASFGVGEVQYFQPYDIFDGTLPETVYTAPGHWISLALRSDDTPCVAFQEPTGKDVKYGCRTRPGSWSIATVESTGALGEGTRLAFNSADEPYIVYYDETNGDLRLAHDDGTGWTLLRIDGASSNVGQYPSLAIDSSDRVHIAYYDVTSGALRYAVGR